MEKSEILEFVKKMKPTDHAVVFYSTLQDKHLVLFTFVREGLDNGEAVACTTGGEAPQSLRESMKRFGIDPERYEETGALKIVEDFHRADEEAEPFQIIETWKKLYDEVVAKGFKGLRMSGETDSFFHNNSVEDLVGYEKALHRKLSFPMTVLCGYDTKVVGNYWQGLLYPDLIKAHNVVLFVGPESGVVSYWLLRWR